MIGDTRIRYVCPYTREALTLVPYAVADGEVKAGVLRSPSGIEYAIKDDVAHVIDFAREVFSETEERELSFYECTAADYDAAHDWLFKSFFEDEEQVCEAMLAELAVRRESVVLETGCGTCRDSAFIARHLGPEACLILQDLSINMLSVGKQRMADLRAARVIDCSIELVLGNAMRLPFGDGTFDAAFHFGGINLFGDPARAIAEMARVVRPGGRVVFGDEGLAPWLGCTEYGKILLNSHPLYAHEVPLAAVPASAREVSVRWLIGNAFYLVSFTVAAGAPPLDLDLPIVGRRGGTHRTRYYGQLEGVTPETRQLAIEAAAREGITLHTWVERVVRRGLEGAGRAKA